MVAGIIAEKFLVPASKIRLDQHFHLIVNPNLNRFRIRFCFYLHVLVYLIMMIVNHFVANDVVVDKILMDQRRAIHGLRPAGPRGDGRARQ